MIKVIEIVDATGVNDRKVLEILESSEKYKGKIKYRTMKPTLVDGDLSEIAAFVKNEYEKVIALEEAKKAEQARIEAEQAKIEAEKRKEQQAFNAEVAKVLVTSGYSFEGYKITKYSGYISGDDAVSVGRGFDGFLSSGVNIGEHLLKSLSTIRQNALRELKEAAYDLGCNAVIGVDFDYIDLAPETANHTGGTTYYPYVFCVTANGTAVTIEKE